MNTLISIIPNIWVLFAIGILILVAFRLMNKDERKQTYDDDMGNASSHLSKFNKGVWIGPGRITREKSFVHTALISQSGGGKTSGVLIPTALALDNCSAIIFGPPGEQFVKTSGCVEAKGFDIKLMSFEEVERSITFNPLERAKSGTELHLLVDMILGPSMRASKDIFWPTMAGKLLVLIFKLQKKLPKEYQNLANSLHLVNLIQGSPTELNKLVARLTLHDNALFADYKAMISHDQKLLSNIIASTQSALRPFEDENISRVTATDTLDLTQFRKKKTVLYVELSIMNARYFSFLVEVFFSQIFRELMSHLPEKDELDVFILADEMGSFTIKGFAEALSNLRRHRVAVTYAIQSRSQLIEKYNREDAHTILANSYHKLIFPGMETDMAQELQTRMGKWSFEREDGSKGTREIMTVSELVHLEEGHAIYTAGPARPMKVKLHPYFKNSRLNRLASLPPPVMKGTAPEHVSLINPLEFLEKSKNANA